MLSNKRILVVEDTLTQAMMIQHVLEAQHAKITIARSGQKAVVLLEKEEPELILCDVNMPEMSGYELCAIVKQDPRLKKIPFVLLSTLVDSADLIRVIESGADDFIYKTFEGEYFLERLKSILSARPGSNIRDTDPVTMVVSGQETSVSVSKQRLADLLVSAFEAAVLGARGSSE